MNRWFWALVPALITFGPFFIALSDNDSFVLRIGGYLGAIGLGFGLAFMFRAMRLQQDEIDALKTELRQLSTTTD